MTSIVPTGSSSVPQLRLLQVAAAFFLALKLIYVLRVGPEMDEAYYWMWGQHPGLSYFDHPPLQGWLLGLSDAVFGRSLLALRWMTLATLAGTFYIYHLWAKRLAGNEWPSLWWPGVVIYLASPTFGYFTSLAFHDYLLVFLLLVSGHFFLNFLIAADAGGKGRLRDLYLGAVFVGLAGLTKYNAVFLGLAVFCFVVWRPSLRGLLRNPHLWLAGLVAVGLQFPVLYWNWQAGFASFAFHLSDRHGEGWLTDLNWRTFVDFPLSSAFLVSPFLIPVFWRFFTRRHETQFENVAKGLAVWAFWLSTLTFLFVALFDWVYWWWNLAAYVLVLPFAARHMGRRWLFWGHAAFGAVVQVYLLVTVAVFPLSILQGTPDFRQVRLYGWEELGQAVVAQRDRLQPDFIASDGHDLASVVGFAIDDPGVTAITNRTTQYAWWFDKEAHRGQNALVVLSVNERERFSRTQFETFEEIERVDVTRFGRVVNGYRLYWGENYQPTAPRAGD